MKMPIAILAVLLLCLQSFASLIPTTVYLATYTNATSYVLAWGATSWATPSESMTISTMTSTNIYTVSILADNSKDCYVTQTTHFQSGPDAVGYTHLGPRTNVLSSTVWTATSPSGPWTNYNSFNTFIGSNLCGFYRIETHFIR